LQIKLQVRESIEIVQNQYIHHSSYRHHIFFRFLRMAAPCNENDALIGNSYQQSAKAPSLLDDVGEDPETKVESVNSIWHSKFNKKTSGIFAMLVFIACVIVSYHIGLDKGAVASTTSSGSEMGTPALKGNHICRCSDCYRVDGCPDEDFCKECHYKLTCGYNCADCTAGRCSPSWCERAGC
jgi:hypothetical protein